ncbi:DUF2799 domain-containing protein [Vibrio sp. ZSDZ34]|uniref:DUF2799 domain-containing protein n=1 Tax=Vibrio gelatinilyticus TaxID=2893468 RepID=A0A9X2AWU0_9VIBR|nr:DUF2799 domain-containing protein [Vibrio gelatinilyticus]MCJ2378309.1 DUF2799 domain-containing protein [Vibrio gelatinilyticus]
MRYLIALVIALGMVGCVSVEAPNSDSNRDWKNYGYAWASKGYIEQDERDLFKLTSGNSKELIHAYRQGYAEGKQQYCQQDPFVLGYNGKIYYGICNDLDPRYLDEYWRGKKRRNRR